jgi:hypothetical protein
MKVQSSNKQTFYNTTLEGCDCPDFTHREKAQNRLSCNCELWYKCSKCSCKHQRDNLAKIMLEVVSND